MTDKLQKINSKHQQLRLVKLIYARRDLELQAAQIKCEIIHLKETLRETQSRIRRVNSKIERAKKGQPLLRLVVSNTD